MTADESGSSSGFRALVWQRKWWVVLPAFVTAVAVGAASYYLLPARYRSETLILVVPQRVSESYVKSAVTAQMENRLQSITQQILSRTRLERIIADFNLYGEDRKSATMEDIVERMRLRDIDVEIVKGDAFRVSFSGTDPRTVMKVTDRLASLFIEENLRDREVQAEGTNQFLEAQLEDTRDRLVQAEGKLAKLRESARGRLSDADMIEYEVLRDSYKSLLIKKQEARISANLERRQIGEQFKLLDPARLPERPVGPSPRNVTTMSAMGGVGGLALGFVFVGASSFRRRRAA
jgi:uncharacterized protein involved in exopolysaccharide biosynthesis